MNKTDLLFLLDYTDWANDRLLQAAEKLTPEQFAAAHRTTYGSLRGILVHVLVAYKIWRGRLQEGSAPASLPAQEDFTDIASFSAHLKAEHGALRAYVASLDEAGVQHLVDYRTSRGEPYQNAVWQIVLQVTNHAMQHRSEAAEVLTEYGCSPGNLDLIVYLRQAA
jgi:uncharacterized damage-inducible protein DinB